MLTADAAPHRQLPTLLAGHPRYEETRYINRGSQGFVMEALDKQSGTAVALKFLARGDQISKYVENEILNHLRLRHPHIITLAEVFLTDDYLVLVLDLASGGNLFQHVSKAGRLTEDDARWFFQQIVFAVDYCHRMGVANRDMKLENVLLMDDSTRPLVMLSDFGFSKDENYQSAPGSCVGTPAYLSPEVISNVKGQSYDAKKADVWSCGVLLFVMLTGRYPFSRAEDDRQPAGIRVHLMLKRILDGRYVFPADAVISEECKDLIARMLERDPLQRLSVEQVLQHPWCNLKPEVVKCNESLVSRSLADMPDQALLQEIRSLVVEARQQRQRPPQPPAGPQLPAYMLAQQAQQAQQAQLAQQAQQAQQGMPAQLPPVLELPQQLGGGPGAQEQHMQQLPGQQHPGAVHPAVPAGMVPPAGGLWPPR